MLYIGQKVVCIEGKYSECGVKLVEQKIYEIKNIWSCKCNVVVDVGLKIYTSDKCYKCNTFLSVDGTWWLYARRFVPLDEWQDAGENIKQLLKAIQEPINL